MKKLKYTWADVCWTLIALLSFLVLMLFTLRVVSAPIVLDDEYSKRFYIPIAILFWCTWIAFYKLIKYMRKS
ncbi:MAG TPA: hypothetical protein VK174_11805 [Chitinophagales bacterium]|nr:hypothetical protein [Chitinophagales bacterium]